MRIEIVPLLFLGCRYVLLTEKLFFIIDILFLNRVFFFKLALEAQLENEHEERTILLRERHELERRLAAAAESDRTERAVDEAALHRLKRDLKKTKALLRDAQSQLERQKAENPGRNMRNYTFHQMSKIACFCTINRKI